MLVIFFGSTQHKHTIIANHKEMYHSSILTNSSPVPGVNPIAHHQAMIHTRIKLEKKEPS